MRVLSTPCKQGALKVKAKGKQGEPPDHTKWKKGQSGNPGGIPKAYRDFSNKDLKGVFGRCASSTMPQLQEILDNPAATSMEIVVAGTIQRAAETRDASGLSYLLDRYLPKPKEPINVSLQLAAMTDEQLIDMAQEHIKALKEEPLTIEAATGES